MKKLPCVLLMLLLSTIAFAHKNKTIVLTKKITKEKKIDRPCTMIAIVTRKGSYVCNGASYPVQATASAPGTAPDCQTATTYATVKASELAEVGVETLIKQGIAGCQPVP